MDKTRCCPGREEGKVPPLLRCGGRDAGAGGRVGPCTAQDASRMAHRSDRLPQPPSLPSSPVSQLAVCFLFFFPQSVHVFVCHVAPGLQRLHQNELNCHLEPMFT